MKLIPVLLIPILAASALVMPGKNNETLKESVKQITEFRYVNPSPSQLLQKAFKYKKVTMYNDKGLQIATFNYYTDGKPTYNVKYEYNSKGKLKLKSKYNARGTLVDREEFIYDKSGNLSEWKMHDSKGRLHARRTYTYDEKDRNIEEIWHRPGGGYFDNDP